MAEGSIAEAGALSLAVCLVLGYLLGSIPFGLLITRAAGLGDVRNIGSGNIGATNVLRTGRKSLAALTLLLDAAKGAVAVWIAWRWGLGAAMAAGMGAFLGHLFPVWLSFKGGKGVATGLGVLLALYPAMTIPGGAALIVFLCALAASRIVSLSAMVASATVPVWAVATILYFARRDAAPDAPIIGIVLIGSTMSCATAAHRPAKR